jgi:hypothetical protein
MKRDNWTIKDYLEELLCICEIIEIPGMKQKLESLKQEMKNKYSSEEREAAGLLF